MKLNNKTTNYGVCSKVKLVYQGQHKLRHKLYRARLYHNRYDKGYITPKSVGVSGTSRQSLNATVFGEDFEYDETTCIKLPIYMRRLHFIKNFLTNDSVATTDANGVPFSSSIKIYRCWIIWRQPWVMVFPILLTLAFLGANVHSLYWNNQTNLPLVITVANLVEFPGVSSYRGSSLTASVYYRH